MRTDHLTDTRRMDNIRRDIFVLSQYSHPESTASGAAVSACARSRPSAAKSADALPRSTANAVTAQFTGDTVATFLARWR